MKYNTDLYDVDYLIHQQAQKLFDTRLKCVREIEKNEISKFGVFDTGVTFLFWCFKYLVKSIFNVKIMEKENKNLRVPKETKEDYNYDRIRALVSASGVPFATDIFGVLFTKPIEKRRKEFLQRIFYKSFWVKNR